LLAVSYCMVPDLKILSYSSWPPIQNHSTVSSLIKPSDR
jgi:hypothetical protein